MQCSVCGSQDTTYKTGTSKKTGKPWTAYDCNEPQCKNEKGYPSRTFAFTPKPPAKKYNQPSTGSTLESKIDKILAILEENFGKNPAILHKEFPIENEESPF